VAEAEGGQPPQGRIPCHHESRNPDSHERRDRHDRSTIGYLLTAEQTEYAEIVRSSGANLLHIINEILDFSKIEAGMLTLEIVEFRLAFCG